MTRSNRWTRLIAGPMLRHVDASTVSVFVALKAQAQITLRVWEGPQDARSLPTATLTSPPTDTLQVGEHLHVVLVVARVPEGAASLRPGAFYAYDITVRQEQQDHTLSSMGLLQARQAHPPHLPLGYADHQLPGFELPPTDLVGLRIAHGSCRKLHGGGSDGLAALDDVLARVGPGQRRPQQLFLTGDQIYADDVPMALAEEITRNAQALIGSNSAGVPLERFPIPVSALSLSGRALVDPRFDEDDDEDRSVHVPLSPEWFPGGWRAKIIADLAHFFASDSHSHMLGFSEYCALYLLAFSTATWPEPDQIPEHPSFKIHNPRDLPRLGMGAGAFGSIAKEDRDLHVAKRLGELAPGYVRTRARALRFFGTLPRAQRVFANVPTWMVFDDHDVTDDWRLTRSWVIRTRASVVGRAIQRNGLLAYTVFQAWGNQPDAYSPRDRAPTEGTSDRARLLRAIRDYLPADEPGPDPFIAEDLDELFGLTEVDESKPLSPQLLSSKISWHYTVKGPRHRVYVLDARTRRAYRSATGPPAVIPAEGLESQLKGPDPISPDELVFVVSSVPVFGPPAMEEVLQPAKAQRRWAFQVPTARTYDEERELERLEAKIKHHEEAKEEEEAAEAKQEAERVRLALQMKEAEPVEEADLEQWPFDTPAFEALLARLAGFGRVVVLSGDVHYSLSAVADYWEGAGLQPSGRIVQLTSSALCNEQSNQIVAAIQGASGQWFVGEAKFPVIRLGWERPDLDHVQVPPGAVVPMAYRARLRDQPAVISARGWPEVDGVRTTLGSAPDFVWRLRMVQDVRPDEQRRDTFWQPPPEIPDDPERSTMDTYALAMVRHAQQVDNHAPRRVVWQANVAVVRLLPSDEDPSRLLLEHAIHYVTPGEHAQGTGAYTVHRVALDHPADAAPGLVFDP